MKLIPLISDLGRMHTDAKSIFDQFAERIVESVSEFNRVRGDHGLHCDRSHNRIAVYKELYPRAMVELEFDPLGGIVRMSRRRLEHAAAGPTEAIITDLRCRVDREHKIYLGAGDYRRLARQALRPLTEAFE